MYGIGTHPPPASDMSLDLFEEIVDQIYAEHETCTFFLMGGEPLLVRDLAAMIARIKRRSSYVDVNTNGLLLRRDGLRLLEAGLDMVVVSLDGPTAGICDAIRGKGVFARAVDGIAHVRQIRDETSLLCRIAINMVVTDGNYHCLDRMVLLCNDIGVDHLFLSFPMFVTESEGRAAEGYFEEAFGLRFRSWRGLRINEILAAIEPGVLVEQLGKVRQMEKCFDLEVIPFGYGDEEIGAYFTEDWKGHVDRRGRGCPKLCYRTTFWPDGSMVPCTVYPDLRFGDVRREGVMGIWTGPRYEALRQRIDEEYLPICYRCCDLLDESDGDKYAGSVLIPRGAT
jgi:MoaA/NifB/PqqE/SkfB family radical SAM enzyme